MLIAVLYNSKIYLEEYESFGMNVLIESMVKHIPNIQVLLQDLEYGDE